ncbi:hypothetical protein RBB75_07965 [Tunturibacter empetritectus]|uniref:DUF885 domain-containing protein n=1 Tax=Tunturiibacter empetritectus TaxID=3069691 RepID=A0AAU7ZGW8_9BACT
MKRMHSTAIFQVLCFWVCLQCSLLLSPAAAQSPTSAPSVGHGHEVPLEHLYWHFLDYQLFLDKKADALPPSHPDVQMLRTHYQSRLGFNDSQYSLVRQAAQTLAARLKQKDEQAKSVIDAFHHNYPPGKVLTLPPLPPELSRLQAEREAIISETVVDLKNQLGAKASATMDAFLHKDFLPTVAFKPMHPPGPPHLPQTSNDQVFTAVKP